MTEMRRSTRCPVDYPVIAEHLSRGDIDVNICNVSAHGLMLNQEPGLERGERLIVRLPHIGRIEAHVIWTTADRAGLQFERILRLDDFMAMVEVLQPNPRLRRTR